ncbi:NCK-interacting protein with SH3 domain-like [Oppia nitens]|uniref:NCK-interacting protein with SH3 domain-like n=1 Tax=Oppia nitens TaxID=1686743 RepID=UPI0023DBCF8E|nr:NCK-interacting protein with SH3 domain-like [Oppia nitens]
MTTVLKAVYEYESNDNKVLNFKVEEKFIVIKETKPYDWVYCVNTLGQLGYVPKDYVVEEKLIPETDLLILIDSIAQQLDSKHNDRSGITDRQVKHAQIKLAQIRCEVVQLIFKKKTPEVIPEVDINDAEDEEVVDSKQQTSDELIKTEDKNYVTNIVEDMSIKNIVKDVNETNVLIESEQIKSIANSVQIDDTLISELIERVRVTSDLSHNMCILTVKTVIECLSERVVEWSGDCIKILEKLSQNNNISNSCVQSSDLVNLKAVFKKLWFCKNDEQQRNNPIDRDEDVIGQYLDDLLQIMSNANPLVIKDEICGQNYERIEMLVTYYQMETRRSLRMILYRIFICLISLYEDIISDYLLTSVLPSELSAEMQNYVDDTERWSSAALVFTAIFSTGHKPPIHIYSHINEKFITQELDLIEGIDSTGNRIDSQISAENSIAPILAFNLHFDDISDNLVLKALSKRRNASQLTENLISYLNWEEDITKVCTGSRHTEKQTMENKPNSALKLLIEMFANLAISKLFYYNDVRVIIDIIIRQLNNLPVGDKTIGFYLTLMLNIIRNTEYKEEPHKLEDLIKCLKSIESHDWSRESDLKLVLLIRAEL